MVDQKERTEQTEKPTEEQVRELRQELDRYRTASEDALQQLDWCIGYFVGCNKSHIAKSLSANRSYIRRNLMHRDDASVPTEPDNS